MEPTTLKFFASEASKLNSFYVTWNCTIIDILVAIQELGQVVGLALTSRWVSSRGVAQFVEIDQIAILEIRWEWKEP